MTKWRGRGNLSKFAAGTPQCEQCAPCKLNNVKMKKDTRRGREFSFEQAKAWLEGTPEQNFFEAWKQVSVK